MKTLIKLLVAAVILNAAVRYGLSAWTQYEFRDSVQETLLFSGGAPAETLKDEIMRQAERQGVPLDRESLDVQRNGNVITADASYVDQIELFPRYVYAKTWVFSVDARNMDTAGMTGRSRRR